MPVRPESQQLYTEFLRSRWPSRTHRLAIHASLGTFVFIATDWAFTRHQAAPPSTAALVLLRLPWIVLPIAAELLRRRAPAWRFLPAAVIALSVVWAWGSVLSYSAIGLGGSIIQAITLFACLVTCAALMPLTSRGRIGVFALMALGYVAFDLGWPHASSRWVRLADDAAVLAFAVIQVAVFQGFAGAQRRGVLLRHELEATVTALGASRQRAADAAAEVGRLAVEVAHQVNNPLAAVRANVRWLAVEGAEPEHGGERADVVVETLQAIDRIAGIVHDLKRRAAQAEVGLQLEETTAAVALQGPPGRGSGRGEPP